MSWYSFGISLAGIFLFIYGFFKWKFLYWKRRGVPTLPPLIPYGNFKDVNKTKHLCDLISEIYFTLKNQGPVAGAYFAFNPIFVPLDLDLVRNILIKGFNHFHDRPFYYNEKDDPLSAHMITLNGDKWKRIRYKFSPNFTAGKMKFMFPTVMKVGDRFASILSKTSESTDEFELKDLFARYTADVIGECGFGIECNSLQDPNGEFCKYGRYTIEQQRHSRLVLNLIRQFPNVSKKLRMKTIRDDVSEFFIGVVRATVAYREANNVRRNDFMDLLIEMKNGKYDELGSLTIEEIAAQAFLFFVAGFETSSTALTYTAYHLALNQDIQEKARKQIGEVLEKYGGQLTYEATFEMPYIDQILTETLRKYPPAVALQRSTTQDYKVPNTDLIIEKDTMVMIPAYAIHHDPEYYPDPDKYDPDRFTPDKEKDRHPMTYLAFGEGPRHCVGLRFGKMNSRIALAKVLQSFIIKPCARTPIPLVFNNNNGLLVTEGGVYLTLEKIKT